MDIRISTIIFFCLFNLLDCCAQTIDGLQSIYSKYYETSMVAVSHSGKFAVLNHHNTYGKDEDELLDIKSGKRTVLEKHLRYKFLGNDRLLMQNMTRSRFQNLKTGKFRDVEGNYAATIADLSAQVVLYYTSAKELILVSEDGNLLWKEADVQTYHLDNKSSRLVYISSGRLGVRDLKKQTSKTYQLNSDAKWIAYQGNSIYCADIKKTQILLYTLNLSTDQLTKQAINNPEDFEFASRLTNYFEIREDEHLIFPLYLKSKLNKKENLELKITYSNKNGNDNSLHCHLGIFNLKNRQWDYQPDTKQKLPVYKFLNDKGDFVVYDESDDAVEEQQNVILDFKLMLDYGKSSYLLPRKRKDEGNYLWDRSTEQFIYFDNKRWRSYHINTGADRELLPLNSGRWDAHQNRRGHSGLAEEPEVNPVRIKGKSAIMLSNQFDYFMVDLKTHQLERITRGEEQQIKYDLQLSKEQYPESSWNIRLAEVDLEEEITFKLLNVKTYHSGFASYLHEEKKTNVYQQGHYKEMIKYKDGLFFTSHFGLEPFKLTKFENGKYTVVYESLKKEQKGFEGAKYQIFQYQTRYGTANAALLFPMGYDKEKKYPMIVNIYEVQSRNLFYFVPPYLTASDGFSYMHYLMNGYIVLLPDLQYEIGHIKNSVITSLESSIDVAKLLVSIDDKSIGVLGLSYGGYETGLALTNSKYFKTGVAGVMISDMVSNALSQSEFIPMPNYMRVENQQFRMKSNVFDDWNSYLENSPIYHMKNIKAPALIWTGLKDKNVPPAQSKMFFLGMKRLKKKAILLEYVNETHNVLKRPNQLDLNVKISQWFDYYLKGEKPADWIKPLIDNM